MIFQNGNAFHKQGIFDKIAEYFKKHRNRNIKDVSEPWEKNDYDRYIKPCVEIMTLIHDNNLMPDIDFDHIFLGIIVVPPPGSGYITPQCATTCHLQQGYDSLITDKVILVGPWDTEKIMEKFYDISEVNDAMLVTCLVGLITHEFGHVAFHNKYKINRQTQTIESRKKEEIFADQNVVEILTNEILVKKFGYSIVDIFTIIKTIGLQSNFHQSGVERACYMLDHYLDLCDKQSKAPAPGDKKIKLLTPEEAQQLIEQDFVTEEQKTRLKQLFIPQKEKVVATHPTYSFVSNVSEQATFDELCLYTQQVKGRKLCRSSEFDPETYRIWIKPYIDVAKSLKPYMPRINFNNVFLYFIPRGVGKCEDMTGTKYPIANEKETIVGGAVSFGPWDMYENLKLCSLTGKVNDVQFKTASAFTVAHEFAHIEQDMTAPIDFKNPEQHKALEMSADKRAIELLTGLGYGINDCLSICVMLREDKHHPCAVERQRYMLDHYLDMCEEKRAVLSVAEAITLSMQNFVIPEQRERIDKLQPNAKSSAVVKKGAETVTYSLTSPYLFRGKNK